MYMVVVDTDACIGCEACATTCPAKIIHMVDGKAEVGDSGECMGCQSCAMSCAVGAIVVNEY